MTFRKKAKAAFSALTERIKTKDPESLGTPYAHLYIKSDQWPDLTIHITSTDVTSDRTKEYGSFSAVPGIGPWITINDVDVGPDGRFRLKGHEDTFVHEFVHYLDWMRRNSDRIMMGTRALGSGSAYYLSPMEFNAYYQQGFNSLDRVTSIYTEGAVDADALEDQQYCREEALRYTSWAHVRRNVDIYWDFRFVRALQSDTDMWTRFLKRLRLDFEAWSTDVRQSLS